MYTYVCMYSKKTPNQLIKIKLNIFFFNNIFQIKLLYGISAMMKILRADRCCMQNISSAYWEVLPF